MSRLSKPMLGNIVFSALIALMFIAGADSSFRLAARVAAAAAVFLACMVALHSHDIAASVLGRAG